MDRKRLNKRQQRLERERRLKKKRRKRIIIIMVELLILAGLGVVAYGMFVMDKMDTTTLNTDDLNIYKSTEIIRILHYLVWIPEKASWMAEYRVTV